MIENRSSAIPAPSYALLSAVLFGASTPAAKLLLGEMSPQFLAGLLYLGSGLGLASYAIASGKVRLNNLRLSVKRSDALWLCSATTFGGILAPLLLMIGLRSTQASSASLLLNLEGVFTALIAWFAFKEHTDKRIVLGMFAIVLGSVVLSWVPGQRLIFSPGSLLIVSACFCWALDNNLTRNISETDPSLVAGIKGLVAGAVNCLIAILIGIPLPSLTVALAAALIGLFAYGISLTLFIKSLRLLGTARTGAYFSTAPFAGALLSVFLLHEQVSASLLGAALLMILGVFLHLTERHSHEHVHAAVNHEHEHVHDEHHQHEHSASDPPGEPHTHGHSHAELRHTHPHYPDTEHRHEHG